ncbi:MAG: GntR family transcriptional regulator [Anaerolineales bacterium]
MGSPFGEYIEKETGFQTHGKSYIANFFSKARIICESNIPLPSAWGDWFFALYAHFADLLFGRQRDNWSVFQRCLKIQKSSLTEGELKPLRVYYFMEKTREELEQKIDSRLIQKQVADWIRHAIVTGRLKIGQRLVETDLADELGVSRAPVREALQFLSAEGLVDHIPRKGRFVHKPNSRQVRQIQEIRGVLEGLAVQKLAEIVKEEGPQPWLDQMQEIAGLIQNSFEENNLDDFHNGNQSFHEVLVKSSEDELLERLHGYLMNYVGLFRQLAVKIRDYPDKLNQEHFRIIEAIRRGDGERAKELIQHHTLHGKRVILDALEIAEADE